MKLHELTYSEGARRERYRKGRGTASGNGKTAGKGQMGQNSRTGGGVRPGFEGGQNPIYRRISKRGFINESKTLFAIVNLASLNVFPDGTVVTPVLLKEHRLVRKEFNGGVKILGDGAVERKLTVQAHKFSQTAVKAIEAAGGKVEVI